MLLRSDLPWSWTYNLDIWSCIIINTSLMHQFTSAYRAISFKPSVIGEKESPTCAYSINHSSASWIWNRSNCHRSLIWECLWTISVLYQCEEWRLWFSSNRACNTQVQVIASALCTRCRESRIWWGSCWSNVRWWICCPTYTCTRLKLCYTCERRACRIRVYCEEISIGIIFLTWSYVIVILCNRCYWCEANSWRHIRWAWKLIKIWRITIRI